MAAYQPIQMPGGSGDFMGDVVDRIMRAREASRKAEQDRAELLLRQQALGQQQQLQSAQIQNYQSEADQRKAAEADRRAGIQREGTAAVIAALDAGKHDLAKQQAKLYGIDISKVAPSVTQMPGNTTMAPLGIDLTAPPAEGEDMAATFDRNAKAIASNAPLAPKEPTAWNINGTPYDPASTEAAIAAEREKTAKRTEEAFSPLGYGPVAGALARGGTGAKPVEVDTLISQRMKADQAERDRREMLDRRIDATQAQHERENLTVEQKLAESAKNRAARIAAAQAGGGGARTDQANLSGYKYADQVVHQAGQELGLPKLTETLNLFDIAKQELGKDSGAAQVGARMVVERALRGGPPTQYMDQQEAAHLGGLWAQVTGKLQTAANGQLGDEQRKAIADELDAAREQFIAARERRLGAIKQRLTTDPALQNLRGTANARYRQLAEGMGGGSEDIFPGEGNALPPVGAGSVAAAGKAQPKTVREKLAPKGDQDAEERKKRLLRELGGL